ncbi:hypothetical protein [Salinarchaeum laminariae]|uniref:hypothetical protein n=1 Tax=Salinarchaeum laminariae TaxID=869888 RepID=UPI0020BD7683|nr:hypothetical protein [Salinarchaeum laminariae]
MLDRRSVLRRTGAALATASVASVAGCLFGDGGNDDGDSDDGGFLAVLPDPRPHVVPSFHVAFSYDPVVLRNELGADPMPNLAGEFLAIVGEMDGTAVADVDRLAGQTVQQVGHTGDLSFASPHGTDLVIEGSIDADGAASWLASQDQLSDLGDEAGYRRFGNGGQIVEAFTVDDATLTFGNREVTDVDASGLVTAAIQALDDGFDASDYPSPELQGVIQALPAGTARIATTFDLVAERPDSGTEAYDEAAGSLLAAGLGATIGAETTEVTRVLRYRENRAPSADAVQTATEAAVAAGHVAEGDWTVSRSGRTVRIEGSVSTAALQDRPVLLRRAVPVPAYADLTAPIDPATLGRDAPPRTSWSATQRDDGTIVIVHEGGPEVDDLTVNYVVDGDQTAEEWVGPVSSGDQFVTAQAPDPDSTLDLVWANGTANETILLRAGIPGE